MENCSEIMIYAGRYLIRLWKTTIVTDNFDSITLYFCYQSVAGKICLIFSSLKPKLNEILKENKLSRPIS